jgi:hypothetical protein
MSIPRDKALWRSVLRQTSRNPVWVGHWLHRQRCRDKLKPVRQAAGLGLGLEGLILLSLCRTPEEGTFADDLHAICERTGADPRGLAPLLRREKALARWEGKQPAGGYLMAASEAEEEADDEPPPAPES